MDSLRVLFFISSLSCGGAENHLLNLCGYLAGRGDQVSVCSLSAGGDDLEDRFRESGARIYYLNLPSLASLINPLYLIRLGRLVREISPDLIHAHLYHAEAAASAASLFTDAPLVVTRHSFGLEFNGIRRLISRLASSRVSHLIAVSPQAAAEAKSTGLDGKRLSVIESGVDTELFRPLSESSREKDRRALAVSLFGMERSEDMLLTGSLGGLRPVKNFPLFLQMARELRNMDRPFSERLRFVIFGEGKKREELIALADKMDIGDVTAFPGMTRKPQKVLPLLDLFVLTSDSEGVPVALLEAMSCGLPCVASRVGGIPDVVGQGTILPEAGDLKGFVQGARSLLGDEKRRARMGAANRELAAERYALGIWGGRNLEVYKSLLTAEDSQP